MTENEKEIETHHSHMARRQFECVSCDIGRLAYDENAPGLPQFKCWNCGIKVAVIFNESGPQYGLVTTTVPLKVVV